LFLKFFANMACLFYSFANPSFFPLVSPFFCGVVPLGYVSLAASCLNLPNTSGLGAETPHSSLFHIINQNTLLTGDKVNGNVRVASHQTYVLLMDSGHVRDFLYCIYCNFVLILFFVTVYSRCVTCYFQTAPQFF
jgi:hypothetical protein